MKGEPELMQQGGPVYRGYVDRGPMAKQLPAARRRQKPLTSAGSEAGCRTPYPVHRRPP